MKSHISEVSYDHDLVIARLREAGIFVSYATSFSVGKFVFSPAGEYKVCIPPTKDALTKLTQLIAANTEGINLGRRLTLRANLSAPPAERATVEWKRRTELPSEHTRDLGKYISVSDYLQSKLP